MIEEQIKQKAEEYVRNKADKGNFDLEQFGKAYFSESSMEHAYIAGATEATKELQKENERLEGCLLVEQNYSLALERQIKRMKCCPNCKSWDSQNLNFCEKGKRMCGYEACEEWELTKRLR